jgi:8-oxo-dGTP pyrophosphatase MutT (NUDIX family)
MSTSAECSVADPFGVSSCGGPPEDLQKLAAACRSLSAADLTQWHPPEGTVPRSAAVLVLFGADARGLTVLLLQRGSGLRAHAGQVAFPGGGSDDTDRGLVETALREAGEETGLDPSGVEVLGVLPALWVPPSNYSVAPVLGWWRTPGAVHAADPAETAAVFVVPVRELLDPANRSSVRHSSGYVGPAFRARGLFVWGFTAGLLARLFTIAGWEIPWDAGRVEELP